MQAAPSRSRPALVLPCAFVTPDQLSGLTCWLAADRIRGLNDGDKIATWSDLSGNGNDLTQATGANQPTYKNPVHGAAAVRFDGAATYMSNTTGSVASVGSGTDVPSTIVVCGQQIAGTGRWAMWGRTTATHPFHVTQATGARLARSDDTTGSCTIGPGNSPSTGVHHITAIAFSGVDGDHVDDGKVTSSACDIGTTTLNRFMIGAQQTGAGAVNAFLNGDIVELCVWNRQLDRWDRQKIERYLRSKWGIPAR